MKVPNNILIPEWKKLLEEGKEVRFMPSGSSMRPFIEGDQDNVILAPLSRDPRVGDILLATVVNHDKSTTYVLHRLVRIRKNEKGIVYILQGDGNLSGEEYCRREDIIGRVRRIESPTGRKKCLTRGRLWYFLKPFRGFLLKVYRHLIR